MTLRLTAIEDEILVSDDPSDEPSPNYLAGQYAIEILQGLGPLPDHAREFHDAVEGALACAGFDVKREVLVPVRESGRRFGYIDLFASYAGGSVAIELDHRAPRAGSLDKLRTFDAFRLIVLRGVPWPDERGIDAIISLPVEAL